MKRKNLLLLVPAAALLAIGLVISCSKQKGGSETQASAPVNTENTGKQATGNNDPQPENSLVLMGDPAYYKIIPSKGANKVVLSKKASGYSFFDNNDNLVGKAMPGDTLIVVCSCKIGDQGATCDVSWIQQGGTITATCVPGSLCATCKLGASSSKVAAKDRTNITGRYYIKAD